MRRSRLVLTALVSLACAGCVAAQNGQVPVVYAETRTGAAELEGDIDHVHDPAVIKEGDTYYLFSTGAGIPIRCSKDLRRWTLCGRVFVKVPGWVRRDFPRTQELWAPDISRATGKYRLYYAVSAFGSNHSAIGLATNTVLDPSAKEYRWIDEGIVISSRQFDDYNAIDPNLV